MWLVWVAEPKPTDPRPADEYYPKGQLHIAADGSFSLANMTMGDTSSWSVGRTWRIFIAVPTDPAGLAWLRAALANDGNLKWDGHRLALPPDVRQIGTSISVTRTS